MAKLSQKDKDLLLEAVEITLDIQMGLEDVVASFTNEEIEQYGKEDGIYEDLKRIEILKKLNCWILKNINQ